MFERKLQKMIKPDEGIVEIVRKYPLVFIWPILIGTVFIIAPFFFLYPLWHWSAWGIVIFFVVLAIGVLIELRVWVLYSLNIFIITDERIIDIDQRGFFDQRVSEITYQKIQDVSFRTKGIWQTVLHYGSVVVQTAGEQANIELYGVKNPERVHQAIIEIQQRVSNQSKPIQTNTQ